MGRSHRRRAAFPAQVRRSGQGTLVRDSGAAAFEEHGNARIIALCTKRVASARQRPLLISVPHSPSSPQDSCSSISTRRWSGALLGSVLGMAPHQLDQTVYNLIMEPTRSPTTRCSRQRARHGPAAEQHRPVGREVQLVGEVAREQARPGCSAVGGGLRLHPGRLAALARPAHRSTR